MSAETKTVILLHPLFLTSTVMLFMSNGFKALGYRVLLFNYKTTKYSPDTLIELKEFIDKEVGKTPKLYLVGHSMGGLVARLFFQSYGDFMKEKFKDTGIVTLGTPHYGSHLGKYIEQSPLKGILGTAGSAGITGPITPWKQETFMGCIAGTSTVGWNIVMDKLHKKKEKSDGTVFLSEAILENAHDSVIINCSHTGLVYSREVIELAHYFILHKYFPHSKPSKSQK